MNRLDVFNQQRSLLFSIAYRMLGSVMDAQDMVQETFLRWQQVQDQDVESPEAYLNTIITRLCINHLNSARVRREKYVGLWLPEPMVDNPVPDPSEGTTMAESISIAFLMLLERLTPMERAVFILRDVFNYEYSDIARILEQKEANCRQILRRARQHLKGNRPRFDPSPQQREALLHQFLLASSQGDMQGLLSLFAEDIVLYSDGGGKASAVPNPVHGADHVARLLVGARGKLFPADVTGRIALVNGQPGIIGYYNGVQFSVLTIDVADGMIQNIYIVTNPDKLHQVPPLQPPSSC